MNARTHNFPRLERKSLDGDNGNDPAEILEKLDELSEKNTKLIGGVSDGLKALEKKLAAEKKEREDLELRMSRPGGGNASGRSEIKLIEERKAISHFMRTGDDAEMKALTVGNDPAAGYLVMPEVSTTLQTKIHDLSPIRQIARVETIGMGAGDAYEEVYDMSDTGATWAGETQSRTETTNPSLKRLRVPLREIYCHISVSQRLLDDSQFDVGGWLENRIADKFARAEGTGFVAGTNVLDPEGFTTGATPVTTADSSRAFGVLQYTASGAASSFPTTAPADVLKNLYFSLRAPFRQSAVWVMNSATANTVSQFKDGMGQYLWQSGLQSGQPMTLMGRPVVFAEDMPSIGAGNYPIAFGDFRQGYVVIDRPGLKMLRDPYSSKPYVIFYAYKRVGGAIANSEAIKLLKIAAS